jgi:hypothetical protein
MALATVRPRVQTLVPPPPKKINKLKKTPYLHLRFFSNQKKNNKLSDRSCLNIEY